jgi:anionic cell wall polymer biosynthesis LytR-Cps2A-Psr (LCP) family protein
VKRTRSIDKGIYLLAAILVIVVAAGIFLYLQVRTDPVTQAINEEQYITVLFVVSDEEGRPVVSEVFFYHPVTHNGAILDVPGDVGLIIESLQRVDRIDVLYEPGDVGPYKSRIERLIGVEIPFFIELDLDGVEGIVDLVEGVDLFIANPVDLRQDGEPVLLPSGSVVLDGRKAVTFLTYEDDQETDIDRAGRRQKFVQAVLDRFADMSDFLHQESTYPYVRSFVSTNMDRRGFLAFVETMTELDTEQMVFQRVLGTKRDVDNQTLLFPHHDGKLIKDTVRQTLTTLADADMLMGREQVATVEVLNGTLVNGLAGRTAEIFRSFGYDLAAPQNADRQDYEHTVVLARKGDLATAQQVARIINCTRVHAEPAEGIDAAVDVTVILGKDFDGRYCRE